MNLLFVCSGNSCRSPMAMAIAQACFKELHNCDSAAGNLTHAGFKSSKKVAQNARKAIEAITGEDRLDGYVPKPIDVDLVMWADWILCLGTEFQSNVEGIFEFAQGKVTTYGCYIFDGEEMFDIPDPFDGDHWAQYFKTGWPGKKIESYLAVATAMSENFQPVLEKRLGLGRKPSQPKVVPGMDKT